MSVFEKAQYNGLVKLPGNNTGTETTATIEGQSGKSIFLIPENISSFLASRGINIVDAALYRNARKILSQDELVQLTWLNRVFLYRSTSPVCAVPLAVSSPVFVDFSGEDEIAEFEKVVERQVNMAGPGSNVFSSRLSEKIPYGKIPYEFINTKLGLAIIIKDGFATHMQDKVSERQFVELYLENAETFYSVEDVAKFPIYKMYLKGFSLI